MESSITTTLLKPLRLSSHLSSQSQYRSKVPTTSSVSNTYISPSPSMNFSLTSLANSNIKTPSSFSGNSLASNYNLCHSVSSSYPNLVDPHHMIETFDGGLVDHIYRIGASGQHEWYEHARFSSLIRTISTRGLTLMGRPPTLTYLALTSLIRLFILT